MPVLPTEFLTQIQTHFRPDFASESADDLATYAKDWTKVFTPNASLLVRPRSTDEVARFVKLANQFSIPFVPSGGRTGYAGGAVAASGEVVLSLERMRKIHPIDKAGLCVRVEAGAVTEQVHQFCASENLFWPVDFASKGSSMVGGNISTNAGGVRVIRYGLTRNWVLGLTVVTPAGEILELNGALEKNNTGIDLRQLYIGSEGILGVVTEAILKLTALPEKVNVFLFSVDSLAAVLKLFTAARSGPFTIMAFEFFTRECAARVEMHHKKCPPFEKVASHYVLLEVENSKTETALDEWLSSLFESHLVLDGTLAADATQAKFLWSLREGISESLAATGMPHKNDISLPIAQLPQFCSALESLLKQKYPQWELCLFGHIGDGNLHVNIMKPSALEKTEFLEKTKAVDDDVFHLVQKHSGSISAEHGIGLLKTSHLHFSRSAEEIQLMKLVKKAFDPKNICNPNKVLPQ
jgi:FAD/FMN-containing dehydrogenase